MADRPDAPPDMGRRAPTDLAEPSAGPLIAGGGRVVAARVAPFALTAAAALATIPLPSSQQDVLTLAYGAALTAAVVAAALLVPWRRLPRLAQAVPPLTYLLVVALLRDAHGGPASGYGTLVMLPVLWFALYGRRVELAAAMGGVVAVFVLPILLVGPPTYPDSEWRRAALWILVAALVGTAVQRLVSALAAHAEESALQAERLRESEERARAIVEQAHEAFFAMDGSGTITDWNRRAETTFGWLRSEALGRPLIEVIVPERLREAYTKGLEGLLAGADGKVVESHGEMIGLHRDGHEFPAEVAITAIPSEGGLAVNTFLHDISDRRRDEEQRARLAAIVESSGEAIIGESLDGHIVSWNPAAERIYGYGADEAVGAETSMLVPPDRHGETAAILDAIGRGERVVDYETVRRRKDRRLRNVSLTVSPLCDDGGEVVGAAVIARDVTAAKRLEGFAAGQQAVTRVLAEAPALGEAIPAVLETIGHGLGWECAAFWNVDDAGEQLACRDIWHEASLDADGLESVTCARSFARGAGLPGTVWESGEPIWVEQIQNDTPRERVFATSGLRCAVGVPVLSGSRLVGVIELLATESRAADAKQIEVLASISSQVGQFFERKRAEEQAVAHAADVAAIVQTRELARFEGRDEVRRAVCDITRETAGASLVVLYEPDGAGSALAVTAASRIELELAPAGASVAGGTSLPFVGRSAGAVEAFTAARPTLASDASETRSFVPGTPETVDAASFLWQPIKRGNTSVGVLALGFAERVERLDERLASVADLLASEAAVAIERVDLLARLEAVARTDDLTGLANRRAWDEELPREISRARRDKRPMCVAMLDIDRFKALNDRHGHQAGDRFLKQAAAAWRNELRATDVLARYGGEEFAVVLPACGIEDAYALLGRLRAATPSGRTCSAGVACWDRVESEDALVRRADDALYEAKAAGRDRLVVARPGAGATA